MPTEIERKFLVNDLGCIRRAKSRVIRQGYLPTSSKMSFRVRLKGEKAFLTLKGPRKGAVRTEFEYAIPVQDADAMLAKFCRKPLIEKVHYKVSYRGITWVIDVFKGDNEGLILAEVELESENQAIPLPPWVGEEVTHDNAYYNVNLAKHPYKKWGQNISKKN